MSASSSGPGLVSPPSGRGGIRIAVASGLGPGASVGPYRLVRKVGEGAFAEVWLAVQDGEDSFQKTVALKILKPGQWTDETFKSLVDEARVCGHLHHPHVVDVLGVFRKDELAFIVMEYVPGLTLAALLSRLALSDLRLPLSVIVDIALQVAEALDHAHNAIDHEGQPLHLVHRDLKPANIMLAPRSGVKVTDFGLAKTSINSRTTQVGILRGTPSYIAPEVWGGRRDFTPGVDLFALGAIISELATGQLVFDGELPSIMGQAMHGSPEADVESLRHLQPGLVPLVLELLRRTPEERLGSAWEVVTWLQDFRDTLGDDSGGLDLFLRLFGPASARSHPGRPLPPPPSRDPAWAKLLDLNAQRVDPAEVGDVGTLEDLFANLDADLAAQETRWAAAPAPVPVEPSPPAAVPPTPTPRPRPRRRRRRPGQARPAAARRRLGLPLFGGVLLIGVFLLLWLVARPDDVGAPADGGIAEAPVTSEAPPQLGAVAVATSPSPDGSVEPGAPSSEAAPPLAASEEPASATPKATVSPRPAAPEQPAASPKKPTRSPTAAKGAARGAPEPLSTPRAEPTAAPSAVATKGCLVFKSSPPGARVWLDGRATGLMAGSGSAVRKAVEAGTHEIGMGIDGPEQTVSVSVRSDLASEVKCDLFASGCTTRSAGACD